MALAPSHRLGQIVGTLLEAAIEPVLAKFAREQGLYLDKKGPRPARPGVKVTWTDNLGNAHDLDFVLERGGDENNIGTPVAFIETAWRRYTKHSRAKAQEIQAAVLPLLGTYGRVKPFAGVVVAGVFTEGSLGQLRSNEFSVVYIPYAAVVAAFAAHDVDLDFDEGTPDKYVAEQIKKFERLTEDEQRAIAESLRATVPSQFRDFFKGLRGMVVRRVDMVTVLPLHGKAHDFSKVEAAIEMVRSYSEPRQSEPLIKFEVVVRYTNKDRITAEFAEADDTIAFLESFA